MKDETKKQLDGIFARHEELKRQRASEDKAKKTREEFFVEEFGKLCDNVILPTFASFEAELKARGFGTEVTTSEDRYHATKKVYLPASATLTIFKDGGRGNRQEQPHFSVSLDRRTGQVQFYRSTMSSGSGGMSGPDGTAAMGGVTQELLEQKILRLLDHLFGSGL